MEHQDILDSLFGYSGYLFKAPQKPKVVIRLGKSLLDQPTQFISSFCSSRWLPSRNLYFYMLDWDTCEPCGPDVQVNIYTDI